MHLGPTTSELYCSMTRIYNTLLLLNWMPIHKIINQQIFLTTSIPFIFCWVNHTKKKRKLLLESCMELWEWVTAPLILSLIFFTLVFFGSLYRYCWKWESHPSKQIFMFRGQLPGTYSWENTSTMRVECLVHVHKRLIQPGLIPSPLDELNTIHATLNAHPTICLFQ